MKKEEYELDIPNYFKYLHQYSLSRFLTTESPSCYNYLYQLVTALLEYKDNKEYLKNKLGSEFEEVMSSLNDFQKEYGFIENLNKLCKKKSKELEDWNDEVFQRLMEYESFAPLTRINLVRVYSLLVLRTYLRDIPMSHSQLIEGEQTKFSFDRDRSEELEQEEETNEDETNVP